MVLADPCLERQATMPRELKLGSVSKSSNSIK